METGQQMLGHLSLAAVTSGSSQESISDLSRAAAMTALTQSSQQQPMCLQNPNNAFGTGMSIHK